MKKAIICDLDGTLCLYDDERHYSEFDIQRDLEASVDKFIGCFPKYKVRDFKTGKYLSPFPKEVQE